MKQHIAAVFAVCLALVLASALTPPAFSAQTPALASDEALAVYYGNLRRRDNGLPPLRANRQLTEAARWFTMDSVEHRPDAFCGHTDTLGNTSEFRALEFGYLGRAGAENAFCGYVPPADAVNGWMNSPGHRANLLSATVHETGLGYYRRDADGRGYVAQMFAADPDYAPIVLNNEAPSSVSPQVSLYAYSRGDTATFAGLGPSREMRIATNPCFLGAAWQPFITEQTYTLPTETGWHSVYVQTHDVLNRTATASDAIYLGDGAPPAELSLDQMSTTSPDVTLYNLNASAFHQVQFSPGWVVDDTFATFDRVGGAAMRVNDADALGGTSFQLGGNGVAWVWTTDFVKNVPLVAYVRLKVNDTSSAGELGRITIDGGGQTYGPLVLHGADFAAAGTYQEFALPFTFNQNPNNVFLIFNFAQIGATQLYVDAISIFSAPQQLNGPTFTWNFPGGNYRGQGIQLRYIDDAGHVSPAAEAETIPRDIQADTTSVSLLAERASAQHPLNTMNVTAGCQGSSSLVVSADANWLRPQIVGNQLSIMADQTGLAVGTYHGTVTLSMPGAADSTPVRVAVTLRVVAHVSTLFVPRA